MKLRIDEDNQIVVEPWGGDEEEELREFAERRFHLTVIKAKMKLYDLESESDIT